MDDVKQQVVDRLKQANNILVTVRSNPDVDLLSACIGLALVLDKMDKHAAAVFSGEVPSTIEFLKPEETIERSPDSLRDFIIALDKSKADKLRYKVEDKVVRIFITPYKTSLSEKDLEFSQGDFNVDAVVALGAHEQQELDEAITQHGRILHDATVLSINNTPNGNLGSINWQDIGASSVCELVAQLVKDLGKDLLDEQIATALLTGIVAETGRFSNEKTTPRTMSLAGDLMSAGANQQLVATELQEVKELPQAGSSTSMPGAPISKGLKQDEAKKADDGTLEIDHGNPAPLLPHAEEEKSGEPQPEEANIARAVAPGREMLPPPEPHITNVHGAPLSENQFTEGYRDDEGLPAERSYLVDEPTIPTGVPNGAGQTPEPSLANPYDVAPVERAAPLIPRDNTASATNTFGTSVPQFSPASLPEPPQQPSVPSVQSVSPPSLRSTLISSSGQPISATPQSDDHETLEEIEESVNSPHLGQSSEPQDLTAARNEVLEALKQGAEPLEPLKSLNANPMGAALHPSPGASGSTPAGPNMDVEVDAEGNLKPAFQPEAAPNPESPANRPLDMPLPQISSAPTTPLTPQSSPLTPPPPVPPPMMPPNFTNPGQ